MKTMLKSFFGKLVGTSTGGNETAGAVMSAPKICGNREIHTWKVVMINKKTQRFFWEPESVLGTLYFEMRCCECGESSALREPFIGNDLVPVPDYPMPAGGWIDDMVHPLRGKA